MANTSGSSGNRSDKVSGTQTPQANSTSSLIGGSAGSLFAIIAASTLLVAGFLGVMYFLDLHEELLKVLEWIEHQGSLSALLFISLMIVAVVFLLPGALFTTGAGFVFGIFYGTLYVVLGTTIGAAVAFLIARYLFGDRARNFLLRNDRMQVISNEMTQHDFKVVLLTRLIPFFPSKLSNYLFGLSQFSFTHYLLASAIGFIPFSLHNVYLGSLAADFADLTGGGLQRSPAQWSLYALGFIVTVAAIAYFNRLARRSLARLSEKEKHTSQSGDKP